VAEGWVLGILSNEKPVKKQDLKRGLFPILCPQFCLVPGFPNKKSLVITDQAQKIL
jgi:hypothetical protein